MPPKNITSESAPHYVDFGPDLSKFLVSTDDVVHDRVPGAWLGDSDSDYEEFSDPHLTKSEARALFKEAMADLQRTTAEADEQRLRRQGRRALREELAAEEGRLVCNVTSKGSKTLAWNGMASLQREIDEEEERLRLQALYEHRAVEGKKLDFDAAEGTKKPASSSKSSTVASAENNVAGVSTKKVRRPILRPSLNSGGPLGSCGTTILAQSNASGVASNNVRRSTVDPPLNSGEQKTGRARAPEGFLSLMDDFNARGGAHTAATRRLVDGGLLSEDQLASAAERAKLRADARAANAEVTREDRRAVAAARARLADEGRDRRVIATVSQPASESVVKTTKVVSETLSQASSTLGVIKPSTRSSAGTAQPRLSTVDGVEQPALNKTTKLRPILMDKSRPENEAGRSAGHFVKSSSTKSATAAASTTATAPSQSVSEKAQAIAHRYADALSAFDKPTAAMFIAHKLNEDSARMYFDAARKSSTSAQLKTPTTPNTQSTKGLGTKSDAAKTAEVDDGFDMVNGKGPSAANGSPLPNPDLGVNQLDVEFSPTLKGFQGWEDDYDSDDSEEWDLGGLAEWKWVGEKSAKESSAAKRQA